MELSFLPKEKAASRIYRHFSINAQNVAEAEGLDNKKLEFFYIGKNSQNLDTLIKAFESGYAAENIETAQPMLKKIIEQTGNIPDIIIAEASMPESELKAFNQFIAREPAFATVPFVLDGSGLGAEELKKLRQHRFINDILLLQTYTRQSLMAKVRFLMKVKRNLLTTNFKKSVETSLRREIYSADYILKRVIDIIVSATLLLLLAPIMLLIALAIKLESKGPIFYIAKRAGRGYKIFDFYKFRTMYAGADQKIRDFFHMNVYNGGGESPVFFKINNDPRITRVGAFLRNTSLDEIPQLVNVLKGDMSLVGNRPLPLYEAATLTTNEWAKRFMAPAGITGLWQIKKRGREEMSVEERLMLDIDYADRSSFLYDLWIMANTPSALIQKTNA